MDADAQRLAIRHMLVLSLMFDPRLAHDGPATCFLQRIAVYIEEDALMHNNFDSGGRIHNTQNSMAIYQRNFAQAITHAHAITWFETNQLHGPPSLVDERQRWIARF